jgi:hypothetical protein
MNATKTLGTVDLQGNFRSRNTLEWAGRGTVDQRGDVECSADYSAEVYDAIADAIRDGETSGRVDVDDEGQYVEWTYTAEQLTPEGEMTITKHQVELVQGETEDGAAFGYVHGEDGGYFFTWRPTLEATLASVEEDEVDGDGELDYSEVVEFLRDHLPTTARGRKMWS